MTNHPLPPSIGIFGGGQLGRMTALAARTMDFPTVSLDPATDCPASQVCDRHIVAPYHDLHAADQLASLSHVVTYEFENVDATAIEHIAAQTPVLPSPAVLRITQDREIEKNTMRRLRIPVPEFEIVANRDDAVSAARRIGAQAVFKTTRWGYDGKGQRVVESTQNAASAFDDLVGDDTTAKVIVEKMIDFEMEISVICARDRNGESTTFPPSENIHVNGILDLSIVPARCDDTILQSARRIAVKIAEGIDVVGLIAVEMFITRDGNVMVNETAPRPHNSGHYTIEGCKTSQFEQLVRILTGMPLGDTSLVSPSAMANLLGDVWEDTDGNPDWCSALQTPGAHLHLYGKAEPRRGRKMGHITVTADDAETATRLATQARDAARNPQTKHPR